jgi:hypothetical protein
LREAPVSTLIVTGAAPTARCLQDEAVWPVTQHPSGTPLQMRYKSL